MRSTSLTLKNEEFSRIFPFFIRLNKDLSIEQLGPSMKKVVGDIVKRDFAEIFSFVLPRMTIQMDFQSILNHQNQLIVIESIEFPVKTRFRGQFMVDETDKEVLFLGSPWITDVDDLSFHNLELSDFAIHDMVVDNLQLIRSKQIVSEDMRSIANEMLRQRDQLALQNEKISELSRFPDENPSPVMRVDFKGTILYSNEACKEVLLEENILKSDFWKKVNKNLKEKNFNHYIDSVNIADKIFELTIVPIASQRYFNVYFKDITELHNYQSELVTVNNRLNLLINNMQAAVIAEDRNRKIITVNQRFCNIFGIPATPSMMVGMDCTESAEQSKGLFQDEQSFIERITELLEAKKEVYGDILYMKNGTVLERDYLPIIDNGIYNGHIWKYLDITEIIHQKESLSKIEEKYRRIIEDLDFGLIEVDLDEYITKVYPAFCKLTGYSEEELLGQNARQLFAFSDGEEILEEQKHKRIEGESSAYELKMRTKSGDPKWVIISGAPIYNERNEVVGSIGIHLDISSRKKMEEDLLNANKKAHYEMRMRELFIANMSHEIRTPMNVISGMTELLGEAKMDDEQRKYLNAIRNSADNLLKLVNDILDFSKIEAGHLNLEEIPSNLIKMIDLIELSFIDKVKQKGVDLNVAIDPQINNCLICDSFKLNQVLINFVGNAVKFTSKGQISIRLTLSEETEHSQTILFAVQDTGIGINKDNIESIFQTFIQEDVSTARNFGGTGLGLSIARSIIEKMGGKIQVDSDKGVGSTFSFELTLKKCEDEDVVDSSEQSDHYDALKSLRILVVEDDAMNQMLISTILEKNDIMYDVAFNGQEAINKLEENTFDLVLMDIQMSVMDGISTTEYIRGTLQSSIPIIALTANASKEDEKIYLDAGMDGHISKPFKKAELFSKMIELMGKPLSSMKRPESVDNNSSSSIASIASDQLYSLSGLIEMAGGDSNFIQSIVETFRTNTPNYLKQIAEGVTASDIEKIRHNAHQLKPSVDFFKVESIRQTVRDIEDACKKEFTDMELVKENFVAVKEVLEAVIKDLYSKY